MLDCAQRLLSWQIEMGPRELTGLCASPDGLFVRDLKIGRPVSLKSLAAEFGVSRETLRRDIVHLEAEGRLKRVHGGFTSADGAEPPFQILDNAEAKRRIGMAAARLVEPNMLIVVDAGSTTLAFAEFLAGIRRLKIVTNSLSFATAIQDREGEAEVILVGGRLAADVPSTYGGIAITQLGRFTPQLAFVSPVAISAGDQLPPH